MVNPLLYALDDDAEAESERLVVRFAIPYSDLMHMDEAAREQHLAQGGALEFGHSLDDLIGGQVKAGFILNGFYEDRFPGKPVDSYIATLFATRAIKPAAAPAID